ncbi:MAG TPA: hypothetical protein ENN55_04420 [Firmicutes bacterium]|nr:hypothetical protein [Bacillota bacterium]
MEKKKKTKKAKAKLSSQEYLERIRVLAEEIYKKRAANNEPGDELTDWFAAEAKIKKEYGIK